MRVVRAQRLDLDGQPLLVHRQRRVQRALALHLGIKTPMKLESVAPWLRVQDPLARLPTPALHHGRTSTGRVRARAQSLAAKKGDER